MKTLDTILENAMIYDGSGSEPFTADLGITKDKIERIGQLKLAECQQRIPRYVCSSVCGWIDSPVQLHKVRRRGKL